MAYQLGVYRRDRGRDYIDLMLDGSKTVDIKLATRRIPPYQSITPNDELLIKESSGPIVGACKIPWVKNFDLQSGGNDLFAILMEYWEPLGLRDEEHVLRMFEKTNFNRYATVFGLAEPVTFQRPVWIEKHDRRVWVADYKPPFEVDFLLKGELEIPKDFPSDLNKA